MRRNIPLLFSSIVIVTTTSCDWLRDKFGGGGSKEPFSELADTDLNVDLNTVPFPQERVLSGPGTYKYDLSQLVGHALFLEKDNAGQCQAASQHSFDAVTLSPESYVKPEAKLEAQTVNNPIYDRKVSNGGSAELSVLGFGGDISDSTVAQLTIVETTFLNFRDQDLLTDWKQKIDEAIQQTGCSALLVRGATIRVVTAKFFKRLKPGISLSSTLAGSVFKANGNIFHETDGFKTETLVSLTAYLIKPNTQRAVLEPVQSEGAAAPPAPDAVVFPKTLTLPKQGAFFRKIPKSAKLREFLKHQKVH